MCVRPRSETFLKAPANRCNERTVEMRLKKVLKMVNVNRCDDLEEIGVFSDGLHCFTVGKFSLQYCRQWFCSFGPISKTWGWG